MQADQSLFESLGDVLEQVSLWLERGNVAAALLSFRSFAAVVSAGSLHSLNARMNKAVYESYEDGFKLLQQQGDCPLALPELAVIGRQRWGTVEWCLHHVEALAGQLRLEHQQCHNASTELSWASPIPCGSHPTKRQPRMIEPPAGHHFLSMLLEALEALFSTALKTLCKKAPLPRGHELIALHRHPDVLLCMRASNWHATPNGQRLLANSLTWVHGELGAHYDILNKYLEYPSQMLVLDEEALTSNHTPLDVKKLVAEASQIRNNPRRPLCLVVIVCGRVLLPGGLEIISEDITELHLHFIGFQRWPSLKHAPSLVSHSRGAALSFRGTHRPGLVLSFHLLQLELAPPQQLTVSAAEPLCRFAKELLKCDYVGSEAADVEEKLLEYLEVLLKDNIEVLQELRTLADHLRMLGKPVPERQPFPCWSTATKGQGSLEEKGLLYLLQSQQLLPLLQRLQVPTRPTQLQHITRQEQLQLEAELQSILEGGTDPLHPDLRLIDKELRLNGELGREHCGTLLECCLLLDLQMHECRLTGHGSLATLLRATHCCSVALTDCQFEDAGRGLQLEFVECTRLDCCAISKCLLEGIRCPSIEEIMSSREYEDMWGTDQYSDLSFDHERRCKLFLDGCSLASLLGGGVVMHHGRQLKMQHCRVLACGSTPKLAAVSVSSCPGCVDVQLLGLDLLKCPYAAVSFFGPHLLAVLRKVNIAECGMGLVLDQGDTAFHEVSELLSTHIRHHQDKQRQYLLRFIESEFHNFEEDIKQLLESRQVVTLVFGTRITFCDGPATRAGKNSLLFLMGMVGRGNLQFPRDGGANETQRDMMVEDGGSTYYSACDMKKDTGRGSRIKTRKHASLPPSVANAPVHTWGARLLPHLLLNLPAGEICQRQANLSQAYEQALRQRMVRADTHPRYAAILEAYVAQEQQPSPRTPETSKSDSFHSSHNDAQSQLQSRSHSEGSSAFASNEEEEELQLRSTEQEVQGMLDGQFNTELFGLPEFYGNSTSNEDIADDEEDDVLQEMFPHIDQPVDQLTEQLQKVVAGEACHLQGLSPTLASALLNDAQAAGDFEPGGPYEHAGRSAVEELRVIGNQIRQLHGIQ